MIEELTRKDRELIKLRAARMSPRSIAGLMGRGWSEARVVSRFAAIDAFEAGEEEPPPAACPVADVLEADVLDDRIKTSFSDWAEEHRAISPAAQLAETRSAPWLRSALSFVEANGDSQARSSVFLRGPSPAAKSEFFLSWPSEEPCLETLPLPLEVEETPLEPAPVTGAAISPAPEEVAAPAADAPTPWKPRREPRPEPQTVAVLAQPAPPQAVRPPSGRSVRLKPVTDRIIRFAVWFAAARWPVEEIAELFDVSPEQLEKVLA